MYTIQVLTKITMEGKQEEHKNEGKKYA